MSAEAGAVFGAHGMGYETILRNLALLNVLWDGGEIAVDRRSKPSFRLRDRRLTFGLMVQPEALRGFLERAGTLPRGSGFIARFLIAWPASTQGTPQLPARRRRSMPAVDAVRRNGIRELLDTPLDHACRWWTAADRAGALATPRTRPGFRRMTASSARSPQAGTTRIGPTSGMWPPRRRRTSRAWRRCFHVLAITGLAGEIDAGSESTPAANVIGWHLHEARRLLADLDAPTDLVAAIRLDAWLIARGPSLPATTASRRPRVYQFGPGCARDSEGPRRRRSRLLTERGRARLEEREAEVRGGEPGARR
jgi:putative DNA primase/helicase